IPHPSATRHPQYCYCCAAVRLACVRPAASVHSEPGSNSSLKYCGSGPKSFAYALSAVVLPRLEITRWLAIARLPFELTCCSVTNVCKMDNFPPARRPHKSPAHTVKDHRNRPQRRVPCPAPKCLSEPHIIQAFRRTSTPDDENFRSRDAWFSVSNRTALALNAGAMRGAHCTHSDARVEALRRQNFVGMRRLRPLQSAARKRTRAKLRFPIASTPSKPGENTRCASSNTSPSTRTARSFNFRLASELLGARPAAVSNAAMRTPSEGITTSVSGNVPMSPSPRTAAFQPAIAISAASAPW